MVELSWLQYVSHAQHADTTLLDLFSHALGPDAPFPFYKEGEHPVLYRVHEGQDHFVLLKKGGLCDTVMLEIYSTALRGHLG